MPPTVFLSYSHKDEVWKDRLVTHLAGLERDGRLRTWNDHLIRAGQTWLPEIETAMGAARVAVLVVSPDFLASEFIQTRELPRLLERRALEGVHVVPVIVKDCLWEEEVGISDLQAWPRDGRALESFTGAKRNTELKKIAKEILDLLRDGAPLSPPEPVSVTQPVLRPLHQLPPPPADFTGRTAELSELREMATRGGVTISGVRGMGGIGKTALALALSRELAPLYPDAQIYLDLQGVSANPVPTAQAMVHVIRAFHPDTRLPESEAEIAAHYRSALHGRRALLLMDNAADADQVRPLIPPDGCLLLVTSRLFFHLPGFQVKDLDEMPPEDARALLLRITPRIGEQAERIAAVCAGVPLALRQAAGTLAERPDLSPASYASRLESGTATLGLIEASLSLSYDLLPAELAGRWRTLSVFPTGFDAPAAATVWELEPEPADMALGELVRRSLVDGDDGRYSLHDLARVFADSRCGEEERTGAQRRHAEHYQGVLAQADDFYQQGGPALLRGLRLVDLEWANIRAGQAWAADHVAGDAELTFGYPHAAINCLLLRLRPTERIAWLEPALQAARQLGRRDWEGSTLGNLGNAYIAIGETHCAIELYEQYLAIARELGIRREVANATGNLGIAYADLGEIHRAIELYEQQLVIAREIGDRRGEANATGNLGFAYVNLGETHRAIELYEQDLAMTREIGDRLGEATVMGNLGNAYAALGETRRAIELYEQHLAMTREIGDRFGEARTSWNLGLELEGRGEQGRAAAMMQVYVDYLREIGHPDAEESAARVKALRDRMAEA